MHTLRSRLLCSSWLPQELLPPTPFPPLSVSDLYIFEDDVVIGESASRARLVAKLRTSPLKP